MTNSPFRPASGRHHVVIIGSGFGGMFAAKELNKANVDITIIDRTNHHLFQPLLYQVATGILSSGEIAPSTRQILRKQDNVNVVKAEVTDIDLEGHLVTTSLGAYDRVFEYDSLIVAAGSSQSYFGNDQFAEFAPGMKTIDDALEIRARVIGAFERAELAKDAAQRERLLTFVIVGAGPTGVELAGQLAELSHRTLSGEYSNFSTTSAKIILLDGAPQVLPPFGKRLGNNAQRELERLGVTVKLNALVTDLDEKTVTYKDTSDGNEYTIDALTKIWSAGVSASPLGRLIAEQAGVEVDRAGRVPVNEDLTVGEHKNVFVVGDMMNREGLPGVAQVAIQAGQYAAEQIAAENSEDSEDKARQPFEYFDKGSMAIVSRFNAVVKMGKVEVTGFVGWLLWLAVHVMFLVGFRNRAVSMLNWGLNALWPSRYNLATTRQQLHSRTALMKLQQFTTEIEGDTPIELRDTTKFTGKR
ncbi:NAD(P)/FAD-dependent oxidoreductase [Corynebacterium alimapuense]|uniref:NADH:ubiquinone reductase (non-electrogenic) n=1 Tax=Corynebacterium alimapuense TaxID=1576874 RepID=A0A3M8K9J6_9CORY|nr:NAD(P)/FAD-dependent oxidoreductase [Corynebacterium alimapuense]RNE49128.1 FAD-dependent oxidoreductase [Corynebacterium alimapuense]